MDVTQNIYDCLTNIFTHIFVSIPKYKYSYNCMYLCLINMKVLNLRDSMKKYNLKNDTENETQLQKIFNYPIYPGDSKMLLDKGFVNIDNRSQGGTQWTCSVVKDTKSFYFDSFGGQPDKFLLTQLPKPIIYHNYKIQDIYSKLCGSYCLYFFYLFERMNYYDTILKMYFNGFK